jgi:large subunit ribosomal protein L24
MVNEMRIRKNDNVLVIAGKDKGKKGKIRFSHPKDNQVVIEGVNFIKRHVRAGGRVRQAGIIELEAPMDVSNVMFLCSRCNRPSRIGFRKLQDGRKVRVCRSCNEVID